MDSITLSGYLTKLALCWATFFSVVCGVDYLNTQCNGSVTITTSGRLESSTSLTYAMGMHCTYHVTVPVGKQVLTLFRRFEMEDKVAGACVDYVEFYDGSDATAAKLNTGPICGRTPPSNVTSSGTDLLVVLATDASANYRGFDIIFTAFTNAPCGSDQFSCGNNICIASSLRCDNYHQCGDESDEVNCQTTEAVVTSSQLGFIIGATCGILLFLVISIAIGVYAYKHRQMQNLLKGPVTPMQSREIKETYPVTSTYRKWDIFGYQSLNNHPTTNETNHNNNPEVVVDTNTRPGSSVSVRSSQTIPQQGTSQA